MDTYERFGWPPTYNDPRDGFSTHDLIDCLNPPTGWQNLGVFGPHQELEFALVTSDSRISHGDYIAYITGGGWYRHRDFSSMQSVDLGIEHNRYTLDPSRPLCVEINWEDHLGGGDQDFNDCVVELCLLPPAVGGVVGLPSLAGAPGEEAGAPTGASGWPGGGYAALAGGLAAGVLAVGAGGWYARRRWLKQ